MQAILTHQQEFLGGKFYLSALEQAQCDKYYVLHWQPEYLFSESSRNGGFINRENICYQIIYLSRAKRKLMEDNTQQVKISFRRLRGDKMGIALVSIADQNPRTRKEN